MAKFMRGGYRERAGRPANVKNKASSEQSQRLSDLARTYTDEALKTLLDIAQNGRTDAARVSAATAILDRGYGKPTVRREESLVDLPPVVIQVVKPSEECPSVKNHK